MSVTLWEKCTDRLQEEFSPQQFITWIRPLKADLQNDCLCLWAPNQFVVNYVRDRFSGRIQELLDEFSNHAVKVQLKVDIPRAQVARSKLADSTSFQPVESGAEWGDTFFTHLNPVFTFDNFVGGKSNQLALAASLQVGQYLGDAVKMGPESKQAHNPLCLYGGSGLGKTHLMHAVGNFVLAKQPTAKVVYLHSERFVADMIGALQNNQINKFKEKYRDVDVLMVDDIQFFSGKERSQEEFFHTFNALLEGQRQVVLTCDRYPKEMRGVEERLKSRFGWGLTVAVEPPDFETRVAILINKSEAMGHPVSRDVAFFVAKRIRSNVRELEGALKRVLVHAQFSGERITVDFAREALKDLLASQDKLITIENIQKTVADYYKIRMADLLSKRRNRSVARPRQMAMALAKELTSHSFPEIGDAFGGRDHTTVLHACKQINGLLKTDRDMEHDHKKLLRLLTT